MVGWGRTNNNPADTGDQFVSGVFSSILQQLKVPDVPVTECKSRYFPTMNLDKHICAGGILGKKSLIKGQGSLSCLSKLQIKCDFRH